MSALAETFEPLNASKLLASNCGAEFSPANGIMSDGTTSDGRFVTRPFVGRVDAYWSFYGATSTKKTVTAKRNVGASLAHKHALAAPIMELGRLVDGWCGEGSVAPGRQTLYSLLSIARYLPDDTRYPDIEVDEEDGALTLRWENPKGALALFVGKSGRSQLIESTLVDGRVRSEGRELTPDNFGKITRILASSSSIRSILTETA
tara:strand:- start:701 stop:1315 length:615 start_codon:yes stop_codon:yes gene_type:complete